MSDWQHFKSLLTKYLNNVATADEQDELMRLIGTGRHDDVLKETFDKTLLQEPAVAYTDMRPERAREILRNIVTVENDLPAVTARERRKPWRWVAAAAIALLAMGGVWWFNAGETIERQALQVAEVSRSSSVFSGRQFVKLPDGSTVVLNEGSQLTQEAGFGGDERVVTLTGEAYFDIAHDASRPFRVITGEVTTTVLGTAFNVSAKAGESVRVTVTRGKVQVASKKKILGVITPDQQIAVNTTTDEFKQTDTRAETVVAWKAKYLIFDDVSMETAAAIIEERYNTKIIFANPAMKQCRITATFLNGEDIGQVLDVISGVLNADYGMQPDGNVKLSGDGCE